MQVYSWLSGGNTVTNTPAIVADHIIQAANAKLSEAVKRNFEEPKAHLQSFGMLAEASISVRSADRRSQKP